MSNHAKSVKHGNGSYGRWKQEAVRISESRHTLKHLPDSLSGLHVASKYAVSGSLPVLICTNADWHSCLLQTAMESVAPGGTVVQVG